MKYRLFSFLKFSIVLLLAICIAIPSAAFRTEKAYASSEYYTLNEEKIGLYDDVSYLEVDGIVGGRIGFDKNTGFITWISRDVTEAVIPAQIDGVKVRALADWSLQDKEELVWLVLPEGIEMLGQGAFSRLKLKEIVIPDSVTSIGDSSFNSLENTDSITLPASVKKIGKWCFRECLKLKSVELAGVETIGEYCFRDCPLLESVDFGKGLKSIDEGCFRDDVNLEYVSVGGKELDFVFDFEQLGVKIGDYAFRNSYFAAKDFSPSYKTGKYYKALHELELNAGETGDYVSDIFKIANSQKGYHEGNSFDEQHGNNTRGRKDFAEFNYWYGEPGTKWCGEFAAWIIAMASVPEEIYTSKYDTPEEDTYSWKDTAYAGGKYKLKKGDVILFYYDGGNHVITVESVSVKGNIVHIDSIDGNWSDSVMNDVYEINAKTGKTTNCWTDINGYVKEIYGPDWSKVKDVKFYTVKFDTNGGKTGTKSKKLSNGAYYGVLPIPTWAGYDFDGWYTDKEGGKKITSYRRVKLEGNTTLYAHWTKNGEQISDGSGKFETER